MLPMIRRGAWTAGLLLLAACGPAGAGDGCGPMQRRVTAQGEMRDGGPPGGTASVTVLEQRGDPTVLIARVVGAPGSAGAPLRGHVRGARLVHVHRGDTIRSFRVAPAALYAGDGVLEAAERADGDPDTVKRMLRRRDGVLLLDTDLAGRERIRVRLTEVRTTRWRRAECG